MSIGIPLPRTNWRELAACRDADPELFFPIGAAGRALRQVDEAKQVCAGCPVRAQCLTWALDKRVTDGVWGGTTEDERRSGGKSPRWAGPPRPMADSGGVDCVRGLLQQEPGPVSPPSERPGDRAGDGFSREFATADGEWVVVMATDQTQFTDLAATTSLGRTFAFLGRMLKADFSAGDDLYAYRKTIAALLTPWFA